MNSAAGYIVSREICERLIQILDPIMMGPDSWGQMMDKGGFRGIKCVYPRPVGIIYAKSTINYLKRRSLASVFSSVVDKYRIFPFWQILRWRRRVMNSKIDKIELE